MIHDFSFDSALCSSFMQIWPLLRVGGKGVLHIKCISSSNVYPPVYPQLGKIPSSLIATFPKWYFKKQQAIPVKIPLDRCQLSLLISISLRGFHLLVQNFFHHEKNTVEATNKLCSRNTCNEKKITIVSSKMTHSSANICISSIIWRTIVFTFGKNNKIFSSCIHYVDAV